MKFRYQIIKRENQQEKMKHIYPEIQVVIEKEVGVSPLNYTSVEIKSSAGNLNRKGNLRCGPERVTLSSSSKGMKCRPLVLRALV